MADVTSAVRTRIAAREAPQVRTFAAEQRAVYDAARLGVLEMGYRVVRGGATQGELDAISSVGSGERTGTARQLAMKVRLQRVEGGTEVAVRITEIIEADSSNRAGLATETPLRDTPQYEVLFRRIGEKLGLK